MIKARKSNPFCHMDNIYGTIYLSSVYSVSLNHKFAPFRWSQTHGLHGCTMMSSKILSGYKNSKAATSLYAETFRQILCFDWIAVLVEHIRLNILLYFDWLESHLHTMIFLWLESHVTKSCLLIG